MDCGHLPEHTRMQRELTHTHTQPPVRPITIGKNTITKWVARGHLVCFFGFVSHNISAMLISDEHIS